jgi:hypothetical protein
MTITPQHGLLPSLREAAIRVTVEAHRAELIAHVTATIASEPHASRARHLAETLATVDRFLPVIDKATTAEEALHVVGKIVCGAVVALDAMNLPEAIDSLCATKRALAAANIENLGKETALSLSNDVIRALQLTTVGLQKIVDSQRFAWVTRQPPHAWMVYWRILKAGVRILPEEWRSRLLEDWMSTLPELDSRWSRASFTFSLLTAGIPRLAWTLRRPESLSGSP